MVGLATRGRCTLTDVYQGTAIYRHCHLNIHMTMIQGLVLTQGSDKFWGGFLLELALNTKSAMADFQKQQRIVMNRYWGCPSNFAPSLQLLTSIPISVHKFDSYEQILGMPNLKERECISNTGKWKSRYFPMQQSGAAATTIQSRNF